MSTLTLKFDPNQEHQLKAIDSTIRLFDGLPVIDAGFQMGDEIVANAGDMDLLRSFIGGRQGSSQAPYAGSGNAGMGGEDRAWDEAVQPASGRMNEADGENFVCGGAMKN